MADATFESVFNPRRLGLLVKRDLVSGYRGIIIAMAAVAGTVLVISVLSMIGGASRVEGYYYQYFMQLLFIGGFIYTSISFREMHQGPAGSLYFTMPTSIFEKFLAKLLATTIGFAVGAVIYMTALSAVVELLVRAIFGRGFGFFNPLSLNVLWGVGVYVVLQSIFLLGSVWFKKLAFLKTLLAQLVLVIGLAIYASILARILFAPLFHGNELFPQAQTMINNYFSMTFPNPAAVELYWNNATLPIILKVLFWGVLAPVCWVITYLRLRETEV